MNLSVIIPCYNEVKTIQNVIESVQSSPVELKEIIVVDDGSQDGTLQVLDKMMIPNLKVLVHNFNKGKGASIRTALLHVTGDIIIIQDADLEYDPKEYPIMIEPILNDKADVVFGSRFQGGRPHRVVYFWHMVGNSILTLLSNIFTDINLSDMETGYKAFRKEVIANLRLKEDRFGFEPEITAKVAKARARVYEVGISYYGRVYSEGKKIGWKDGFRAIYCIARYNLFD